MHTHTAPLTTLATLTALTPCQLTPSHQTSPMCCTHTPSIALPLSCGWWLVLCISCPLRYALSGDTGGNDYDGTATHTEPESDDEQPLAAKRVKPLAKEPAQASAPAQALAAATEDIFQPYTVCHPSAQAQLVQHSPI